MRGLLLFLLGAICGAIAMFFMMTIRATSTPQSPSGETAATKPNRPSPAQQPPELTPQPSATSAPVPLLPATPPASSDLEQSAAANPESGPLASSALLVPVEGFSANQLTDTFDDARAAGRRHDAIDIMAPQGTRVLAVADGTVVKLFTSVRGGLTVYEFDPTATVEYYYAHLDGYAPGLTEGMALRRGDPVGFVGSTGDANPAAPHLHFEIAVLGPEKNWWKATDINPYPILTGRQTLLQAINMASQANASSSPAASPPPSPR